MRECERESGIADQNRSCGPTAYLDRTYGQSCQGARYFHFNDMGSLTASFHKKFGVTGLTRCNKIFIVCCPELFVLPGLNHGLGMRGLALLCHSHGKGIITRAHDRVVSGREHDFCLKILNNKAGALGGGVTHHQHHAEVLVQEPDVAGNDDDTRDRCGLQFAHLFINDRERKTLHHEIRDLGLGHFQCVGDNRCHTLQLRRF